MEEKIKTVAIFMGLFQDDKGFWGFKNTPERQRCHSDRIKDIYRYDRDWNLLMEVVEKIENLSKEGETYMFSITKFSARVTYKGSRIVDLPIDNTKIEAVYNACVKFIKWYNEQK